MTLKVENTKSQPQRRCQATGDVCIAGCHRHWWFFFNIFFVYKIFIVGWGHTFKSVSIFSGREKSYVLQWHIVKTTDERYFHSCVFVVFCPFSLRHRSSELTICCLWNSDDVIGYEWRVSFLRIVFHFIFRVRIIFGRGKNHIFVVLWDVRLRPLVYAHVVLEAWLCQPNTCMSAHVSRSRISRAKTQSNVEGGDIWCVVRQQSAFEKSANPSRLSQRNRNSCLCALVYLCMYASTIGVTVIVVIATLVARRAFYVNETRAPEIDFFFSLLLVAVFLHSVESYCGISHWVRLYSAYIPSILIHKHKHRSNRRHSASCWDSTTTAFHLWFVLSETFSFIKRNVEAARASVVVGTSCCLDVGF